MTVVYLDRVVLLNLAVDYLLLLATARLAGLPLRRRRLGLCAALGAAYAAAVFLPGSEALTYPAVLWPGLVLAAAVPAGWVFWALAEQPVPLPPEQLLEKQKPPYRVPDTEVLFVSRSLDLS